MLKRRIQGLPLLLILPSLWSLPTLAQSISNDTEESSSAARAVLPNPDIIKILETWVQGSHAQEDGNIELARKHFQNNKRQIEQIPAEKQPCFRSFNETLLEGAMTNQSPDFLKVESHCFDKVILLLSVYSASTPIP